MSDFEVNTNVLQNCAGNFERYAKDLSSIVAESSRIISQIDGCISTRLSGTMPKVAIFSSIKSCQFDMITLSNAVRKVTDAYCGCEKEGAERPNVYAGVQRAIKDQQDADCPVMMNLPKHVGWRTGTFSNEKRSDTFTTVYVDGENKNAYVRIYTYNRKGKKTKGEMHIVLRDEKGNWVWEGDIKSGAKLKLGNDHKAYRIYITKKEYDTTVGNLSISQIKKAGDNFVKIGENADNCHYWAINAKTNCYCIE